MGAFIPSPSGGKVAVATLGVPCPSNAPVETKGSRSLPPANSATWKGKPSRGNILEEGSYEGLPRLRRERARL